MSAEIKSNAAPLPEAAVARADEVPHPSDLTDILWNNAETITVSRYWSGDEAPLAERFEARCLWSPRHFGVLFNAAQDGTPVVSPAPVLDRKTIGLWERDVCELFLAKGGKFAGSYLEFEVAPTGEWLDLEITAAPDGRETEWDFDSGMECAASIEAGRVVMAVRIPWEAFGERPNAGSAWRGNLYRAVGAGETRGYLAWSPTLTETPDFHVPERFGTFIFT